MANASELKARVAVLERELAEAKTESAACIKFIRSEIAWADFRGEVLGDTVAEMNFARLSEFVNKTGHGMRLLEELAEARRWYPISEAHEDFGQCAFLNINDPLPITVASSLDDDFEEDCKHGNWTHFQPIRMSSEYAEELLDAAATGDGVCRK